MNPLETSLHRHLFSFCQTELQRQQWRCAESEAALKAERGVLEVPMKLDKTGCGG